MPEADWTVPGVDTEVATPARMYDYYLGGKDNFAADRDAAEKVLKNMPKVRAFARANRAFLGRAVRAMAAEGISQFLDIGIGLPGPGGTVASALAARPDAHVVGVDNDPIVLAHARARPVDAGAGAATIVAGDLRDPAAVLADPRVRGVLDFERPIGVMLIAVLHFVSDDEDPYGIVNTLMDAVAPGSFLALTHVTGDFDQERLAVSAQAYEKSTAKLTVRSAKETAAFFDGRELLEPGVVLLPRWRPDGAVPADADDIWMYGALGRKN
ncbi:SAM-dependent methyltransferase [Catenulispora sp. NF23]|uniref:SAM-dependent methyltransferase n=1 Tax=Catenulispora pinistramenti TaxID=2705254 RepID=A0ABS5KP70_9ACTN|nr:SAM-dependent methyltransferase [Catenulispora pinistramenti]MBS2532304.1 SAM-dependent methyltransferase [Catenulispora pinistramenti]MBS2547829.1 SAM-dependent methyltransferase [Catenulispora pinistramenti]